MTPKQLLKQLELANKQLMLASNRLHKISQKVGIEENQDIKKVISDVEKLIEIGKEKENVAD